MLAYWVAFFVPVLGALPRLRVTRLGWVLIAASLSVFIGLRYQVGTDWGNYLRGYFYPASQMSFIQVLASSDPGYVLINWLAVQIGAGSWLVNLFSASFFSIGLIAFCRRLPEPVLALVVAVPYMVIVFAMGYNRQAVAFGFALWALTYLLDRRLVGFVVLLAIASTFHKSAVILIPMAMLANTERRVWTGVWVGLSGILLYWLFLAERMAGLWDQYVESDYSQVSEGGPIRVAMNVLPAIIFLIYYKRFAMNAQERKLWFWIAALSIACLPLVFQAPTAVDRVALYFTPIQLVVFSYLPSLVNAQGRVWVRGAIIAYYALVEFVWLNYAGNAYAWLPYQFWPLASG